MPFTVNTYILTYILTNIINANVGCWFVTLSHINYLLKIYYDTFFSTNSRAQESRTYKDTIKAADNSYNI